MNQLWDILQSGTFWTAVGSVAAVLGVVVALLQGRKTKRWPSRSGTQRIAEQPRDVASRSDHSVIEKVFEDIKQEDIKVVIVSPKNEQRLPHAVPMTGEIHNLPPDKELWIVTEPHPRNFHPHTGPVLVQGQKWMGSAFIGNHTLNADTGRQFTIHIVLGLKEMGRYFKDYLENAHRTGAWPGIPSLFGGKILSSVRVIRDDSEAGEKDFVDYRGGLTLVQHLIDVFIGYSEDPPSKSYDDYNNVESRLKDWLFTNRIDADPEVVRMMEDCIKKIRGWVISGNKWSTVFGGTGRPGEKTLQAWDRELWQLVNKMEERIRFVRTSSSI